jgi:hypothetical protein
MTSVYDGFVYDFDLVSDSRVRVLRIGAVVYDFIGKEHLCSPAIESATAQHSLRQGTLKNSR